jgi:1-acyl-sn-glycerol-3-phosphate acyltransferase
MPFLALYRFFKKKPLLLFCLVVLTTVALGWFGSRIKLEEDISKFIPSDERTKKTSEALRSLKFNDKIILNFSGNSDQSVDPADLMSCADWIGDTLQSTEKNYISDLQIRVQEEVMSASYDIFYDHLPVFLDDSDFDRLSKIIHHDSINALVRSDYRTLLSPSGMVMGKFIRRDPLSITGIALRKVQGLQFDDSFTLNQGYVMTRDDKHLLAFITPSVPPGEHGENKRFLRKLDGILEIKDHKFPSVKVEYYGAAPVSLGNSEQIRKDTLLTSIIAVLVIAFMLFIYFRRFLVILYIFIPVAFGAVFSLALLYFLRDEISAIAIGAGSIVLGIAINYSLHFFTHFKHERSVENVIRDLSLPMLLGCTTTVGAFLSLQFTKSQALHDFGLFAGFSLIGAMLFSIIVLPHLLKKNTQEDPAVEPTEESIFEKLLNYRFDKNKYIVIGAVILTVVFAFAARFVRFESDMMKMNFQPPALAKAQQNLDRINKFSQSSVYVVSQSRDKETALRQNEKATEKLRNLQKEKIIGKFAGPGSILISDSLQKLRIARWNKFWSAERKDSLKTMLERAGIQAGFKPDAFSSFYEQIGKHFQAIDRNLLDSLTSLIVKDWINEKDGGVSVLNLVKVDAANKQKVYVALENEKGIVVFDRQFMTNQFVEVISSDFNLILLLTSLLVFGFMLLSHGRIELALINFLPMLISWIWILGLMGLLGIKFNIINIIISTFIFGLGDDYSIFILDGLSHEYKYGRKSLSSYKSSIVLSALTNIVGIGVLIFAEHPALRSIATITLIGMWVVLFISFIVQPLLYGFLILNRKRKGLLPYTALNIFITASGFIIFMIGSILLSIAAIIIFFLFPLSLKRKKLVFHYLLMCICKFMIYLFVHIRKDIDNPHRENFSKPAVIIANHQSHIDLAFLLMLHPKMIVFTNDWVWNSPFYGYIVRKADFYPASHGYENAIDKIKELTGEGYSVLIFPEGTRSATGEILRFHKGSFYLAERLGLDILPLLMHGTGDLLTKSDFHFKEGRLTLKFLPRISPDDPKYGHGYKERAKAVNAMMRREYAMLREEKETVRYYRARLIKNYIFKGPVLEWYCRIKVKLENNYAFFESLLPKKGHITDIGCGYGFLSLMLSFMSKDRTIEGYDYDEEKISIAANCISRSEKVTFHHADVTAAEFGSSDAFVINDVLHYLFPEDQKKLIGRCAAKLNPGGIMIIRDADAAKKTRHLGTRYTEFFSTNSGFNKIKEGGLHFSTGAFISQTLDQIKDLEYEIVDDTKLTSNITFVVRHKQKQTT